MDLKLICICLPEVIFEDKKMFDNLGVNKIYEKSNENILINPKSVNEDGQIYDMFQSVNLLNLDIGRKIIDLILDVKKRFSLDKIKQVIRDIPSAEVINISLRDVLHKIS